MSQPSQSPAGLQGSATTIGRLALKRALLGIVLLGLLVSTGAWLMHAGIEADADTITAAEQAAAEASERDGD